MTSKQEQEFNEMLKHYNISVAEDIAGQPDPERQHNSEAMMEAYPHGPQGDEEGFEPIDEENANRKAQGSSYEFKMGSKTTKKGAVDKAVDNPSHYDVADTTVQKILESFFTHQELMGWIKGNILKYRLRAFRKGKVGMQDIAKADEYQKFYDDYRARNQG